VVMGWPVSVLAGDGDGDGWHLNADCDDGDPDVNPGAMEILFNGIDDDCNGDTPDIGTPAVVEAEVDVTAVEGVIITITATFSDSNLANTHEATAVWGGDTITQPITITNNNGNLGWAHLSHPYLEDGVYTATFTVCNDAVLCTAVSAIETVNNLPPVVTAESSDRRPHP